MTDSSHPGPQSGSFRCLPPGCVVWNSAAFARRARCAYGKRLHHRSGPDPPRIHARRVPRRAAAAARQDRNRVAESDGGAGRLGREATRARAARLIKAWATARTVARRRCPLYELSKRPCRPAARWLMRHIAARPLDGHGQRRACRVPGPVLSLRETRVLNKARQHVGRAVIRLSATVHSEASGERSAWILTDRPDSTREPRVRKSCRPSPSCAPSANSG
jgi:hypothetical protein